MRKNLGLSLGMWNSQTVLLALIRKGLTREDAYSLVQRNAMKTWEVKHAGRDNADFLEMYVTATIAGTAGYLAKVWSSTEIGASELDSASLTAVNAQVVDALSVDTYDELASPPAATSSLKDKITWLFMYARNKVTQTALARTLYRDDTTTVAGTSATSDNGTTFTKGEDT
jgi:hypothetical protein